MIRPCRHSLAVLATLALLPAACSAGAAVPRIDNPAAAPVQETWTLRETWRVGADPDDVLLGQVAVIRSGPDGEIYALDSQLSEVQVFGPDGDWRRTLGREGEGPGEFRQPTNIFWTDDGHLAVQQSFPGRIVFIDPQDGTPRGSWSMGGNGPDAGGFGFLDFARERGGTFAVAATSAAFDMEAREMRDTSYLAVIGDDDDEQARLAELKTTRALTGFTIDELANHDPADRGHWDVGPDGRIYLVPRYDAYLVQVREPDGALAFEFLREHEARLRNEQEKEEQRDSMQININGMEPEITWKLQDRAPSIDRLQILDDGSVWILDSQGGVDWPDEGRQTFGVFSPDGKLQREVIVDAPLAGEGNRLILLDDGRVMMVKGLDSISVNVSAGDDETIRQTDDLSDTILELICFEVER